ncbi:DUF89 domain-containing protein [Candidatus Omnitrophota bacterium]
MRTYFDCVQCFVRQALDSAQLLSDNDKIHEKVLRKILSETSEMDFYTSPPVMGQRIHHMIRELLGDIDPYCKIKDRSNRLAMKLYPELKLRIEEYSDSLDCAVRFAIAGNIIDFGVNSSLDDTVISETLEISTKKPLLPNTINDLRKAVDRANNILYLGDNAGEIVFDRLLIEQLPHKNITFAVRGGPVINDATLKDAEFTGLTNIVKVIDNGSDAPGTIINDCSQYFRRQFINADLIISKGQGNYESLSEENKNIVFLLMAKCPVIAQNIGSGIGSLVLKINLPEGANNIKSTMTYSKARLCP